MVAYCGYSLPLSSYSCIRSRVFCCWRVDPLLQCQVITTGGRQFTTSCLLLELEWSVLAGFSHV
uniref:Uncharacterized protein n=1 Tax=Anguilla anguilla TaxID=7936 RepID=A0A0E9SYY7_ANGAN